LLLLTVTSSRSATITPTLLVPLDANNGTIRSETVDWAIVLRAVGNLPDRGQLSLNHTRYDLLVDDPIVVGVVTKPEGENIQQAYVQLAVWASAHMNLLHQLLTDSASSGPTGVVPGTALPLLPLLIAQGSQWSFLFASRQVDGTTVGHLVQLVRKTC
jgi:hypothetical protein